MQTASMPGRRAPETPHQVSHVVAIVLKRVLNGKGDLMPTWEEIAAVSIAAHNFHLALCAAGCAISARSRHDLGAISARSRRTSPQIRGVLVERRRGRQL